MQDENDMVRKTFTVGRVTFSEGCPTPAVQRLPDRPSAPWAPTVGNGHPFTVFEAPACILRHAERCTDPLKLDRIELQQIVQYDEIALDRRPTVISLRALISPMELDPSAVYEVVVAIRRRRTV